MLLIYHDPEVVPGKMGNIMKWQDNRLITIFYSYKYNCGFFYVSPTRNLFFLFFTKIERVGHTKLLAPSNKYIH